MQVAPVFGPSGQELDPRAEKGRWIGAHVRDETGGTRAHRTFMRLDGSSEGIGDLTPLSPRSAPGATSISDEVAEWEATWLAPHSNAAGGDRRWRRGRRCDRTARPVLRLPGLAGRVRDVALDCHTPSAPRHDLLYDTGGCDAPTIQPSSASARAQACPIPLPVPVTKATRLASDIRVRIIDGRNLIVGKGDAWE